MENQTNSCDHLARLLSYPREDYQEAVQHCRQALSRELPEAASFLAKFAEAVQDKSAEELEELYTQTFDLNPACCLELGWHLYGENYERGELLVKVRSKLRRHGIAESIELPDHLTHVLPLLGRMDREEAGQFAASYLLPALEKMLASLAGKNNPFENVLQAVERLVQTQTSVKTQPAPRQEEVPATEGVAHE